LVLSTKYHPFKLQNSLNTKTPQQDYYRTFHSANMNLWENKGNYNKYLTSQKRQNSTHCSTKIWKWIPLALLLNIPATAARLSSLDSWNYRMHTKFLITKNFIFKYWQKEETQTPVPPSLCMVCKGRMRRCMVLIKVSWRK
jgi:hypothetical protein